MKILIKVNETICPIGNVDRMVVGSKTTCAMSAYHH